MRPVPAIPMPLGWGDLLWACAQGKGARERFEAACREYHGAKAAFALSSGRAALWVALRALRRVFPKRKKVILPAYTCPTVGRAVLAAGLEGLCVDVAIEDFNIDPEQVEKFVDDETVAVVAAHMFGTPCDVEALRRICDGSGVVLIEDVAQACGARYDERLVGTFGELSFLSLGRSKNLRGYKGGVLLVNSEELLDAVEAEVAGLPDEGWLSGGVIKQAAISLFSYPSLWNLAKRMPFLKVGAEDQSFDEHPSRMASWQAGIGLVALRRVDEYNQRRSQIGQKIERMLREAEGLQVQAKIAPRESVYTRLATLLRDGGRERRDRLVEKLQEAGIDARAFYSRVMYRYPWWEEVKRQPKCSGAETVVEHNFVLPLYFGMDEKDAEIIAYFVIETLGLLTNE